MTQDELKKMVGIKAASMVEDNTVVGLGTGSTVFHLVNELGRRVNEENLHITGVATSVRTAEQARSLGIPVKEVDEVDHIDLTIDGADEIDEHFQGIKGGGAAHLFEKIVAINSRKNMWIVDQSKMVKHLGSFPLPVEVIPSGSKQLLKRFDKKGLHPKFRTDDSDEYVTTDSGNFVIDLNLGQIDDPIALGEYLKAQVGVVEHGLFLDLVNTVIVGRENGPEVLQAR